MKINYKTPSIEEYEEIIEIWDKANIPYRPKGRDSKENIKKEIGNNPEYWIGAYRGEELVGVVFGSDDGRKAWIHRLAVKEKYRKSGIGKRLLFTLENNFKENGLEVWAALVEEENKGSMRFFEKQGYSCGDIKYYTKRKSPDA